MKGVFGKIHEYTKKVPKGKVTTYGEISNHLKINNPRTVGWALHANKDRNVPCHRVVNKEGRVSDSYAFDGWEVQKTKLIEEGVSFISKKKVDLSKYLWNPES
jgi:methylated-DNA-protein-cysteine methyltransferase-like protein